MLVIGDADLGSVVDALYPAQKTLACEINPKVFSAREWNAKLKAKSAFTTDVVRKPKVFLVGDADELAGTGRTKPGSNKARR